MALKKPESMEELVYYTSRDIGKGEATCWVFREKCPKCSKCLMGKPKEKEKVKRRAKIYACPECSFEIEKQEYEASLTANIEYVCPECSNKGEIQIPFKRKSIKGIQMLRFQCQKCNTNIDITKKMKEKKE